jgi:hypothetical protein
MPMLHNMADLLHVLYLLTKNPFAGTVDIPASLYAARYHRGNSNDFLFPFILPTFKRIAPEYTRSYEN